MKTQEKNNREMDQNVSREIEYLLFIGTLLTHH